MRRKVVIAALAPVALTAALSCLDIGPAGAQTMRTTATTLSQGMSYVAVASVGTASASTPGMVNATLVTGEQILVPASAVNLVKQAMVSPPPTTQPSRSGITPDNSHTSSVAGNCGSSYVKISTKSDGAPYQMDTGFSVNHDAISYEWEVYNYGDDLNYNEVYDYTYNAGGDLDFDETWHGHHQSTDDYPVGDYLASVNPSESYAVLDDGDVCVSGGPEVEGELN